MNKISTSFPMLAQAVNPNNKKLRSKDVTIAQIAEKVRHMRTADMTGYKPKALGCLRKEIQKVDQCLKEHDQAIDNNMFLKALDKICRFVTVGKFKLKHEIDLTHQVKMAAAVIHHKYLCAKRKAGRAHS